MDPSAVIIQPDILPSTAGGSRREREGGRVARFDRLTGSTMSGRVGRNDGWSLAGQIWVVAPGRRSEADARSLALDGTGEMRRDRLGERGEGERRRTGRYLGGRSAVWFVPPPEARYKRRSPSRSALRTRGWSAKSGWPGSPLRQWSSARPLSFIAFDL